jgi:hypothetical protein
MKANVPGFTITREMVDQAKHEKDRLESEIADLQRKLGLVAQFLRMASAYYQEEADADASEASEEISSTESPQQEDIDPSNMTAAIARIANDSAKPITKSELKAKLIESGIKENRLGSYFYVAIDRLKEKERICVLDDGRVWRAPPKN